MENFNTSSWSHQAIPWNCDDKILGAEDRGPTYGAEDRELRKTNTQEFIWNSSLTWERFV